MVTETPDVPGDRQVAGASSTQTAETPQALRNWWAGFLKRSKKDHNTGTITFITSFCHSIMPSLFLIFLLYIFFFLATVEIFTLCLKLILPSAHASMILSVVDEMPILPPHEFIVEYIVDMMAFCMIALLPELLFTPVLTFIADTLSVANRLATIRSLFARWYLWTYY